MVRDPYDTLGVARDASDDDIRKAYRKLVKQLHPDLNPGDKAAESRFKDVAGAYDILGDPEKRGRFDRGEIDASGAERPEHGFYRQHADGDAGARYSSAAGFEDFEDMSGIFADLFGGRPGGGRHKVRIRGQDAYYRLEVAFLDAANGAQQRITLPDGQTLDVTIPAGTRDGSTLRLRGKGQPGLGGGPPGDALVEVSVRPHPLFRRSDDLILSELPVSIDEAVLGAQVEVPTIGGRVRMAIPRGASSGDVLRLKGKGVKLRDGRVGDHHVTLKIVMPEKIDPELEAFMTQWRRTHRYDPRTGKGRT